MLLPIYMFWIVTTLHLLVFCSEYSRQQRRRRRRRQRSTSKFQKWSSKIVSLCVCVCACVFLFVRQSERLIEREREKKKVKANENDFKLIFFSSFYFTEIILQFFFGCFFVFIWSITKQLCCSVFDRLNTTATEPTVAVSSSQVNRKKRSEYFFFSIQ